MPFILRFVQHYKPSERAAFLRLEAQFAELERRSGGKLPVGTRCQPYAGPNPTNTLIWQCQLPTIQAVNEALAALAGSGEHEELFARQGPFMTDAYTEIYEVLDL